MLGSCPLFETETVRRRVLTEPAADVVTKDRLLAVVQRDLDLIDAAGTVARHGEDAWTIDAFDGQPSVGQVVVVIRQCEHNSPVAEARAALDEFGAARGMRDIVHAMQGRNRAAPFRVGAKAPAKVPAAGQHRRTGIDR